MSDGIVVTVSPESFPFIEELKRHGAALFRINGAFGFPNWDEVVPALKALCPLLIDIPGNRGNISKPRPCPLNDQELIELAVRMEFDYVGLSYINDLGMIEELRERLRAAGEKLGMDKVPRIVGKLETEQGYLRMTELIPEIDLVMIDRADLATAIGYSKVPRAQDRIVRECKRLGKPVIVASKALLSVVCGCMGYRGTPSCAEVTDILHVMDQGANYLMLSEETAIVKDPVLPLRILADIKANNRGIVGYSYGVFDLFHPGHVRMFEKCKRYCDFLVVGVIPDEPVRIAKGEGRPVMPWQDRMDLVQQCDFVDHVVRQESYDEADCDGAMQALIADGYDVRMLIKGNDWDYIPGTKFIESIGGQCIMPPYDPEHSTTSIVKKMTDSEDK